MRTIFSYRFDHPVERIWPFLSEPERWLEYTPALVERTRLDTGPVRPGSMWRSIDRIGPVQVQFTDELIEWEPLRRVVWRQSAPWNSTAEFRLEPDEGGTLLHVVFEGQPTGRIRWMELIPESLARAIYRNDIKTLAHILDRTKAG